MTLKIDQGKHLNKRPKMIFGLTMWGNPEIHWLPRLPPLIQLIYQRCCRKLLREPVVKLQWGKRKMGKAWEWWLGKAFFCIFLNIFGLSVIWCSWKHHVSDVSLNLILLHPSRLAWLLPEKRHPNRNIHVVFRVALSWAILVLDSYIDLSWCFGVALNDEFPLGFLFQVGDHCQSGDSSGDPSTLRGEDPWVKFPGVNWLLVSMWVFQKNRGTPKWMVYNGKPY